MSNKMIYAIYEGETFIVEKGHFKSINSLVSSEWHSQNDRKDNNHYREVIKVGYEKDRKKNI